MKRMLLAGALTVSFAGGVWAQTAEELANDTATPGDVLTYGMGQDQKRFSPLDQINVDNVSSLTPVWAYSLADTRGQENFPLIRNGVMYVTTHKATIALDAKTGKQLWKAEIEYPAETPRVACCGILNRGAALYDDKLFRTTLDAHVIALNPENGEEIWRTKAADYKPGYSFTVAPLVVNGVVIVGSSGAEYGTRGFIDGYDAQTGERLWRRHTIAAPGEPGGDTWPEGDAWQKGGGSAWLTGTYDPELDTVYWGTGNAGPWNAMVRPGDNLYVTSLLALNPKTGDIKWHYQFTPNDPFDYDGVNELVLAEIDGKKVVMQANRNGFFYVLDRTNGELLAANGFVEDINWAEKIDLETGRPVLTEVYHKAVSGEEYNLWPGPYGGKNWSPMSYSPDSNTVFINTNRYGATMKAIEPEYRAGTFYLAIELAWDYPEDHRGELRAIDPMTGDLKWSSPTDIPRYSGVMSTGGNLVFTGSLTGEFEAFNAETGDKLWEFNTGSGIIGQPMTWEMDGKQYVTVVNGLGGVYAIWGGDERLSNVSAGGSVWTFALPGSDS
ncbi:MAG: PQQ-dependent dehydrogenase, methanol/ethanol family [Donghicola eburneus]|uniref:PQQ-dependent dehydrogenase, methanol/ethanol family n=1 Tax=Primorskyibacter sp. 2E233 TaxID=3413431 RepID=UPI0026EFA141|nr:PQQ-dependent dehydrogenase, methanol/ethanol family [Donghicola eburneus]MCI5038681.1 PQQ-dependent dehydrogenase, methanol/ethanol family [Donghicola eburneus]